MPVQKLGFALAVFLIGTSVAPVSAQVASPELEACRSTGLIALRERNPSIKDVSFDVDGMTVAKANTKVEDTPIKTIVIGNGVLLHLEYFNGAACQLEGLLAPFARYLSGRFVPGDFRLSASIRSTRVPATASSM